MDKLEKLFMYDMVLKSVQRAHKNWKKETILKEAEYLFNRRLAKALKQKQS